MRTNPTSSSHVNGMQCVTDKMPMRRKTLSILYSYSRANAIIVQAICYKIARKLDLEHEENTGFNTEILKNNTHVSSLTGSVFCIFGSPPPPIIPSLLAISAVK